MRTEFSAEALQDPATAAAEAAIRRCVRCGFCTSTCPTYVLSREELDGPRGRIYLMKDMLENERQPTAEVVQHIDRCLSCLSCVTTCPSDVNYRHLVDHARRYIGERYRRPWGERLFRRMLLAVLPYRRRFALALTVGARLRPFAAGVRRIPGLRSWARMLESIPATRPRTPSPALSSTPSLLSNGQLPRRRVLLAQGCVEGALAPGAQAATRRLLTRLGYEVIVSEREGCCGALAHHLGEHEQSIAALRRNVAAWGGEGEVAAIVSTASGCSSMLKDYGWLLRGDAAYAAPAKVVAERVADVCEFIDRVGLPKPPGAAAVPPLRVAYHPPCSLQHGQRLRDLPVRLLREAGFEVQLPQDAHLCCGSAGSYSLLQPDIADALRERKLAALHRTQPDVIVTGNVGCAVHLAAAAGVPVLHTVELLDWAYGGPVPDALAFRSG
ncbi:MAG: glycolate oxidase subunit GlcF [Sinobacteraceae bacterium]|nr:glycolate oxidase subunit GlcF [Nevskiaceae bacterium]